MSEKFKHEYASGTIGGWLCFAFFVTNILLVSYSHAIDIPQLKSDSVAIDIPKDHRVFHQHGDSFQDDTPGKLMRNGGYSWRDVMVTKNTFRTQGERTNGVTVEIVTHSPAYPFVIHDYFGVFRGAGVRNRQPPGNTTLLNGVVDEGTYQWNILKWKTSDPPTSSTISIVIIPRENSLYAGNLGWYSKHEGRITTVMMFFSKLDGVPVHMINKFLVLYPSSVNEEEFHPETWVSIDVRKWTRLLKMHKGDDIMFMDTIQRLFRYDRDMFGARDALTVAGSAMRAGDMAAVDQAIETICIKAEQWLIDRDKK